MKRKSNTAITLILFTLVLLILSSCAVTTPVTTGAQVVTTASSGSAATTVSNRATQAQPSTTAATAGSGTQVKHVYTFFFDYPAPDYPEDGGRGRVEVLKALDEYGIKGFDYKVTLAIGEEYITKLNLLATSNSLPDCFKMPDVATAQRFADEDLVLPLNKFIEASPHLKAVIPDAALQILRYNDDVYALPEGSQDKPANGPVTLGFVLRKDWLDALKLKVPTTLTEYHDVLLAMVNNDPNQNGSKDTLGLVVDKNSEFEGIFGAYGVIPASWFNRDGVLKQGSVLPEAKEALSLLRTWYSEGIIDPDYPITEVKQKNEKIVNEKTGFFEGSVFNVTKINAAVYAPLLAINPKADLDFIAPPIGPKGSRGVSDLAAGITNMRAVAKTCPDPDLLFKVLDWVATDKGYFLTHQGIEGYTYTYDKAKDQIIPMPGRTSNDDLKEGFNNPIKFFSMRDRRWMEEEGVQAVAIANKYKIPNLYWRSVPAQMEYDVTSLWAEYKTKIITGVLPLDAWDEYVQKYYNQGGKQIEEQVNADYKKNQG